MKIILRLVTFVGLVALLALAASCGGASGGRLSATGAAPLAAVGAPTLVGTVPLPTETATMAPTPTLAPSLTPTVTPTSTPRPTRTPRPTPTHALSIDAARAKSYPGSMLSFVETLDPGENYDRYIVSYRSEGNRIYALMTVPWGQTPETGWPVIIFNHGYIPPDEYRTTERYIDYMDYFARAGYIVFRSDYRGHGESEGDAGGAYSTPNYVTDVLNGMAAVKGYDGADPDRIGMWGHSMGGYITLRAMVISDEIKAGVIWGGVVGPYPDLFVRPTLTPTPEGQEGPTFTPTPVWRGSWRRSLVSIYGTPEENPAFWDSISATAHVEDISGPLQLHHATTDVVVPVQASLYLQEQMEAAGMPSELLLYEGDNHNISANFYAAMARSLAFFDDWVKNATP